MQTSFKKKVIYFHGGGLVSGNKNDYPKPYIRKFEELNFEFIGFNYPLAPSVDLSFIINECIGFIHTIGEEYILFGRSAGAYLVIQILEEMHLRKMNLPQQVILFYGYENFDNPYFLKPLKIKQTIQYDHIKHFLTEKTSSDIGNQRYLLYLYARQEGIWPNIINDNNNIKYRSASILSSDMMPKTFLAHSANDVDVPYLESKKLNQKISNSTLCTVYYKDHEFDNEVNDPQTIDVMNSLWTWLKK